MLDWEMRGARGIEFGVDLPAIPAIGLGVSTAGHRSPSGGDSWGRNQWDRVLNGWRKEEKPNPNRTSDERALERARDDAVVKSSTDKLSAVLDWVSEQVPTPSTSQVLADVKARTVQAISEIRGEGTEVQKLEWEAKRKRKDRNELETKGDLERFYVALSRKLYDEGL
jgi:triacylglycerol lipase